MKKELLLQLSPQEAYDEEVFRETALKEREFLQNSLMLLPVRSSAPLMPGEGRSG
jgi:hypothetical protein